MESIQEIKSLWESNRFPIALYINSPFCLKECTYCAYRGCSYNKEESNLYFNSYLPSRIDDYKDIIFNTPITTIYFGGGTTNIGDSLDHLIPTFEKLKGIKCEEKIIELHMGFPINDHIIEQLHSYNFTTIILCQQTFNKKILNLKNRICGAQNNLDNIIHKFHNYGIKVALDMMVFPELSNFGVDNLKDDLNFLENLRNIPDEISFGINYFTKTEESTSAIVNYLIGNTFLSKKYIKGNGKNHISQEDFCINMQRFFEKSAYNDYKKGNFYSFTGSMTEHFTSESERVSVLGIGSYKNKDKWVYSRIGQSCAYYEICEDLNKLPKYEIVYNTSIWRQLKNIASWCEKNDIFLPEAKSQLVINPPIVPVEKDFISQEDFHRKNLDKSPLITFKLENCSKEYEYYFSSIMKNFSKEDLLK